MLRIIKRCFWITLLSAGLGKSWAFSLLGPLPPDPGGEPWQVVNIGYVQGYFQSSEPGGLIWLGDIGGPHNIGEGYRRNVPVIYYSYDASFTGFQTDVYFGTNGMNAIDSAFGIINSLTNVDSYSQALTELPLYSQHYNYEAQSLYLTDLKSVTLHLAVEQLGLADPARYSWTLHERDPGTACPETAEYLVVQRNFDGTSAASDLNLAYSPYVNGQLLTYYITEHCQGPPPALATTVPYLTDPAGARYEPVAANNAEQLEEFDTHIISAIPTLYGLQLGGYYTGLTRDDVAGLRYLFTTNNIDREPIAASSLLFSVVTNFTQQALFPSVTSTNITGTNGGFYTFDGTYGYGDFGWLVATSVTNSPAVLQTLYPGLVIASSSNYFGYITNWIFTQYVTNAGYGSTFPPPQILVTVSNPVVSLQQKFLTTFANVFTNNVHPATTYQLQTITVTNLVGAPFGSAPVTNTTVQTITRNVPSGDFFVFTLFHTNICPIDFLYTGLTNLMAVTNILTTTNLLTTTTGGTTGSSNAFASTVLQINYVATNQWVVHPVNCTEASNAPNLYQGIGGVKFQRVDYDSDLGQYVSPITNYYTMVAVTNSQLVLQRLVRVITQPDIVLAAQDLALGPGPIPFNNTVIRNINFNSSQEIAGLRGPGIIDQSLATPTTFTYNKVGPIFLNGLFRDGLSFINPTEVNETTEIPLLQWASFDGSTNAPVLYPNTSSIQNLESQIVVQLTTTPGGPLVGTNGTPYSVQFNASGGAFSPPFTWSATGYPVGTGILYGLPPGLTMSSNGVLSGTPTSSGTYDFVLILTDTYGRSVQWNLSIIIN